MNQQYSEAELRQLCEKLMRADTEQAVIDALQQAGLWDDDSVWHPFGGIENNYSSIGNQQSRSEAALVEKLVNSVDARLTGECLVRGIDPASPEAPQTIVEAVAKFFDDPSSPDAGRVHHWSNKKRQAEGEQLTLTATGCRPEEGPQFPCLSIADSGEGQAPEDFHKTFLSLNRSNKVKIKFVQGKFNMGGTGALRFCGERGLQLIVSKRNPDIQDAMTTKWGFSIVRREDPAHGSKSSVYKYLAPTAEKVFSFSADTLPIFPHNQEPYSRPARHGTLIKLYEYEMRGFRSSIVIPRSGLLPRLDSLLPEVALPIRLYECRSYGSKKGSSEINVAGIGVRLSDDKDKSLEDGFPVYEEMTVDGQPLRVRIYAFKEIKRADYLQINGIHFSINGQTHGHFDSNFFRRKSVGLSYLASYLFVTVDCSEIEDRAREQLFMNSRDRLANVELRKNIESALEQLLKRNEKLRLLKNARKQAEIEKRIENSQPVKDVLTALIATTPALKILFRAGTQIPNPFDTEKRAEQEAPYEGEKFPTYFRFLNKPEGHQLTRDAFQERLTRIDFETDAANDYFERDIDCGEHELTCTQDGRKVGITNHNFGLSDGVAHLHLSLPDSANPEDLLKFRFEVSDVQRVTPFVNKFTLRVRPPQKTSTGSEKQRKPPSKEKGSDRSGATGLSIPDIHEVERVDWEKHGFDKFSALKATHDEGDVYDYFVNVDNIYLHTHQKNSMADPAVLRKQFMFGLFFIAVSLIQHDKERNDTENDREGSVEESILHTTQAIAPVLLPMIEALGTVEESEE